MFLEGSKSELTTQILKTDNTMIHGPSKQGEFLTKNNNSKFYGNFSQAPHKHLKREKVMQSPMITWEPIEEEKKGNIGMEVKDGRIKVFQSFKSDDEEIKIKSSNLKMNERGREKVILQ